MKFALRASLPFPLHLTGEPYEVYSEHGPIQLCFDTVRRQHLDERIAEAGNVDFVIDRIGTASFSRVSAEVDAESEADAIWLLLQALNRLIRHLRNELHKYWIHELEREDLFLLAVRAGDEATVHYTTGRTQGITPQVLGLSEKADTQLRTSLSSDADVVTWRLLYLDAEEAFATGRYEQAVIMGWTALESACWTELPRLARARGKTITELCQDLMDRLPSRLPLSHEQVVSNPNIDAARLISACAELANAGYDGSSLAMSVGDALRLRNVIAHRGLTISRRNARRALDAVEFVLRILNLPSTKSDRPFDQSNWLEHFGKASVDFQKLLNTDRGKIVLYRHAHDVNTGDPMRYWFELEKSDGVWTAHIPERIDESIAAALTILNNDMFDLATLGYPSLRVSKSARDILMPGLLELEAGAITQAVYLAYASKARKKDIDVRAACLYAINSILKGFATLNNPAVDQDSRQRILSAQIAAYFINVSQRTQDRVIRELSPSYPNIATLTKKWADLFSSLDANNPHSICATLRSMRPDTMWLDTIVVDCPAEGVYYGTQRWPRRADGVPF